MEVSTISCKTFSCACYSIGLSLILFCSRCLLTAMLDGSAKKGEKAAIITVAKPPSDIHIEVDGETTAAVIVNYPENKERKVEEEGTP